MKVLIALDQTRFADKILATVCQRLWPDGCQFKILTVIETDQSEMDELAADSLAAQMQLVQDDRLVYMKKHLKAKDVFADLALGHPAEQIVHASRAWGADLIILGFEGSKTIGHQSIGAVVEAVVRRAPCSVLIVKPDLLHQYSPSNETAAESEMLRL